MNRELFVYPDAAAVARAAATHFVEIARAAIALNGRFNVSLSGGETPHPMHRLLASNEFASQVDWSRVHVFWGDERCVPPDHPDSNYSTAKAALLDHVLIPPESIHRVITELDPSIAAKNYEHELTEHFASAVPRFDLILLGLGTDGHTASLFPGAASLDERERLALAVQQPGTGQWRVTLTLPVLNAAANVTFIVTGAGKASSLNQVSSATTTRLPAGLVRPADGQLRLFGDSAAAGR